MTGYATPADVPVSDDYNGHRIRTPTSREPGTDYATPYGTPIRAAANGVVRLVDSSNGGAEGRRLSIQLDNGEVIDYIHLSQILVRVGDRVSAGTYVALSGASGYGQDWYYGPHVHVTRRANADTAFAKAIDFEKYNSPKKDKDEEMIVNIQGKAGVRSGGAYYIEGGRATFLGGSVAGVPSLSFEQGSELGKRVSGI